MDPSRLHERTVALLCALLLSFGCEISENKFSYSCESKKPLAGSIREFMKGIDFNLKGRLGCNSQRYTGSLDLSKYPWLRDRRIFIDPGHGGLGKKDQFRVGPGGITEEEVNLRVGRMLAHMLGKAGARVSLSRNSDRDIPLEKRVSFARDFKPDVLLSVHHNGSIRRQDGVNYPLVLVWGVEETSAASFDLARLLLAEFDRIIDRKGRILSDFAIFPETGTHILRETRYLCPGVIGEAGFFSDETHAVHLRDREYLQREAEAYFSAIAEYLRRGTPSARLLISCPLDDTAMIKNLIREKSPLIALSLDGGAEGAGVDGKSILVTLDGVRLPVKRITDTLYLLDYGRELFPGSHCIRFSFKNNRGQSSMIDRASFTVEIKKGDYETLVKRGSALIGTRASVREGLLMLLAARSMAVTDPEADNLILKISQGFSRLGDASNAWYYRAKLHYFFPQSAHRRLSGESFHGHRFPVEYLGRDIGIRYDPELKK